MLKLLSKAESNMKLKKSIGKGFLVSGLSLRPASLSGYNVCPWSGACRDSCVLEHAGRGNMRPVQEARDRKTKLFFEDRETFMKELHTDLDTLFLLADDKDLTPLVRLNVASDIVWEAVDKSIFTEYPGMVFYDYTKGISRFNGRSLPSNYHLTYSWNEKSDGKEVANLLRNGFNVAVVFDTMYNPVYHDVRALPQEWKVPGTRSYFPVVDGDTTDLRLPDHDGRGVIVGLRGKGGEKKVLHGVNTGFIMPTIGGRLALSKV